MKKKQILQEGIILQEEIDNNEWLTIDEAKQETLEAIRQIYGVTRDRFLSLCSCHNESGERRTAAYKRNQRNPCVSYGGYRARCLLCL